MMSEHQVTNGVTVRDSGDEDGAGFEAQFTELTPYYDQLMAHVPYEAWVDYVEKLFDRHNVRPQSVVDLACGTGNVTFELALRGYQVVGVDLSPGMLREARRKQPARHGSVEFVQCDLRTLALPTRFDAGVCLYDSLNYLTDPADLQAAFRGVRSVLKDGAYFIFDVNSEYAFEAELFTQDNLRGGGGLKYLWKSVYNPTSRLCRVEMYFEVLEGAETKRFREIHYERCYRSQEIRHWLAAADLDPLEEYEAYTFRSPRPTSQRIFFVARAR